MIKRVISAIKRKLRESTEAYIHDAVFRRKPFDYAAVAYLTAAQESARFLVDYMPLAKDLRYKSELLEFAVSQVKTKGLWLEFGVFKGRDIRVIAGYASGKVYGFDSFEGLPEDWTFFQRKGRFSIGGKPPEVPDNVELVKGWFHDTLPEFLSHHSGSVAFLHIDSDLYSSARYVLFQLRERIVPGTLILFDDFLNYPSWKEGESKAFFEFLEETGMEFEFIGFSSLQQAVLVKAAE